VIELAEDPRRYRSRPIIYFLVLLRGVSSFGERSRNNGNVLLRPESSHANRMKPNDEWPKSDVWSVGGNCGVKQRRK
jgi:hypothetical protein